VGKPYTVQRGDTLMAIARRFGLNSWQDLYNSPDNAAFRARRPNPNLIFPGDIVVVPDGLLPSVSHHIVAGLNPHTTMEVKLVARSTGKPTRSAELRSEGHAAIVVNLGQRGSGDHWLAQGGPNNGYLVGNVKHCPPSGWHAEFSLAYGAIWDTHESLHLAVSILMEFNVQAKSSVQLIAISNELNQKRLRYNYEAGPNSNSYVRMFLDRLGMSYSLPPSRGGLVLKGWNWRG
jgi:hypothetical protein